MTDAPERIWAVVEPDDVSADILGDVYAQQTPDGMVGKPVEYIRADLAKPRVKPLVWEPWYFGDYFARTLVGVYNIKGDMWRKPGKRTKWEGPCENPYTAAQADYERRIMEALE